ncbi:MAG: hypothetical protein HC796_04085 [Synechococcaceae cyanobacterium RL_1_2]|nr:hypothetical protein [Synechococcaceae cyanobacterium RL_1_2]
MLLLLILVINLFPNIFSEFQQVFDRSFNFSLQRILNMSQEADSDLWYARRVYLITKLNRLGWATGIGYDNYFQRLGEFQEIHSLFPSLIVISGVFSAIFFGLFFLVRLYKNQDFYSWSAIAGIVLYSITHQFLRDSNMWAILGLMK